MKSTDHLKHILVIEDNPGDAQLIREVAEPLRVAQWHIVQNIIQARDFIERKAPYLSAPRPDLVMLDLKSPVYPGHSFIATVKSNPALRDCKIVVFTSSHAARDRAICAEMGADGYVVKPIALSAWTDALLSALHILDQSHSRATSLQHIDIDLSEHVVNRPPITLI